MDWSRDFGVDGARIAATGLRDESLEDPTWAAIECVVSKPDATQWLEENRPEISLLLQRRQTESQAG